MARLHRNTSPFSDAIDHRARLYSIAAAAASVSVLALAQPAEAEVVITNTNIPITGKGISIDLNHDGVNDVKFKFHSNPGASRLVSYLSGKGVVGNALVVNGHYVSALMRSAKIGPSAHFGGTSAKSLLMEEKSCTFSGCQLDGDWGGNHPNRFVGVKFKINGATHYGWIRVKITSDTVTGDVISGTVTEYGYETIANKVVKAGLASKNAVDDEAREREGRMAPSLGAFALGADGLVLWRRDDTQSSDATGSGR